MVTGSATGGVTVTNATTPASVGADVTFTTATSQSRWQFVVIGGHVYFAVQRADATWSALHPITEPERFGELDEHSKFGELRSWIERFAATANSDD